MNKEHTSFKLSKGSHSNTVAALSSLIVLIIIGSWVWYWHGGGFQKSASVTLQEVEDQVAVDAVNEYQLAKKSGDLISICVQAQFVSAAYLQAEDESNYLHWKQIEKNDCKRAGIPL